MSEFRIGSIIAAGVLAGAYPRNRPITSMLIHAARVTKAWPAPLCRNVAPRESVTDDSTQWNRHEVDCPACLAKLRRLGVEPPKVRPW